MKKILLTALLLGGLMATASVTKNVFRPASQSDSGEQPSVVMNNTRAEAEASEFAYGNTWYGHIEKDATVSSDTYTIAIDYAVTALEGNKLQVDATMENIDKLPYPNLQMQITGGTWVTAVKNADGSYTWTTGDLSVNLGDVINPLQFYFAYQPGLFDYSIADYKFGAANEKPVKEILPKLTAKAQNITANSAEIAYEVTLPEELTDATVKVYLNDAEATASPIALTDLTPSTDYSYTMKAVATKDGQDYTGKEVKVEFTTNRDVTEAVEYHVIIDGMFNKAYLAGEDATTSRRSMPVSIETTIKYNPDGTVTIEAVPHCVGNIVGLVWKANACEEGHDNIKDMKFEDGKYIYTSDAKFQDKTNLYVQLRPAYDGGDAMLSVYGYQTGMENEVITYGEPASVENIVSSIVVLAGETYPLSSIINSIVKDANNHYLIGREVEYAVAAPFSIEDGMLTTPVRARGVITATCGEASGNAEVICFLDNKAQDVHAYATSKTACEHGDDVNKAFDGDESSLLIWNCNETEEHELTLTLDKEYDIQAVQLVWEGASATHYTVTLAPDATVASAMEKAIAEPKVFTVENGEGGGGAIVYKNLYSEDLATIPTKTVTLKTSKAFNKDWGGIKLAEMKVMGTAKDSSVGVEAVELTPDTIVDVYNLQGVRVLRDAKVMDIISLPAGIYVAGGRKYIVR